MSKPKYLKRITKPSQLKAGVRYMRMYVNEHWVGMGICTPCGQVFAYRPDYESSQKGALKIDSIERQRNRQEFPNSKLFNDGEFVSTWLHHCYTVKWSHKAEAFFNQLAADKTKRTAWNFLTGKFSDAAWQDQLDQWAEWKWLNDLISKELDSAYSDYPDDDYQHVDSEEE